MASKYIFLFLLFQQCFSMPQVTTNTNAASLINQVCSKTKNFESCVETLASAPRSATANLKALADFSLKSSYMEVFNDNVFMYSLLKNVTDPGVKQVLEHCKIDYDGSISALQQAIGALGGEHFGDVKQYTYIAMENVSDCDRVIKLGPPPPGLPDKCTRAVQLADISKVISDMLLN